LREIRYSHPASSVDRSASFHSFLSIIRVSLLHLLREKEKKKLLSTPFRPRIVFSLSLSLAPSLLLSFVAIISSNYNITEIHNVYHNV